MHVHSAAPKPTLAETRGLTRFIHWWTRRRTRKRAFRRACLEYRATHPHFHDLCFDKHFLTGRGAEALAARDPEVLALAWTTQFSYRDEKRRAADVRQLFPAAESLLELLAAEEKRLGLDA